ncbi:MAG: YHS domain-containing protein [Nitrososphaerota archaeon]
MKVKKEGSIKSTHLGETYYFCSEYCKTEFEKNPERYINTPSNNESHTHSFNRCC